MKKIKKHETVYSFHSYPTAMGRLRDDGTYMGEKEIIAKIKELINVDNPPCEIHLTLQVW